MHNMESADPCSLARICATLHFIVMTMSVLSASTILKRYSAYVYVYVYFFLVKYCHNLAEAQHWLGPSPNRNLHVPLMPSQIGKHSRQAGVPFVQVNSL